MLLLKNVKGMWFSVDFFRSIKRNKLKKMPSNNPPKDIDKSPNSDCRELSNFGQELDRANSDNTVAVRKSKRKYKFGMHEYSDFVCTLASEDNSRHKHKKGVVITSRVHPGEAQSSFVVQGLIEFLLSSDPIAVKLRDQYVFKIIPMLNPDGVVYGNYRCSLLGFDLNRRWAQPNKHFDPTIYYTKKMMKKLAEEREIFLY